MGQERLIMKKNRQAQWFDWSDNQELFQSVSACKHVLAHMLTSSVNLNRFTFSTERVRKNRLEGRDSEIGVGLYNVRVI